jgi:hypothetical protein
MRKRDAIHLPVLLFLTFSVFWLNTALGGAIATPAKLAAEFKSPPDSPQDWTLKRSAPTKYRVLFRWLVSGTWRLMSSNRDAEDFLGTYVSWSICLFGATVLSLYSLLRILGLTPRATFLGSLLFLASPPVTLAYIYPVHTREDPLAYFLVVAGIIAAVRRRGWLVSTAGALGGLTRGTALILLVPYLLASDVSLRKKAVVSIPPLLSVIGIRVLLGYEFYNPLAASVRNFRFLPETLFFAFLVFGVLWLPGLLQLRRLRRQELLPANPWSTLSSSGPLALTLMMGTHLLFARVREIRISFLLFPWMAPLAVGWLQARLPRLRALMRGPGYWVSAGATGALIGAALLYAKSHMPPYAVYPWAFPWLVIASIHLFLTLTIVLPAWVGGTSISGAPRQASPSLGGRR